jgi:hypothetical protein
MSRVGLGEKHDSRRRQVQPVDEEHPGSGNLLARQKESFDRGGTALVRPGRGRQGHARGLVQGQEFVVLEEGRHRRSRIARRDRRKQLIACARTVNAMLDQMGIMQQVRKSDLRHGDQLLVATENSVYSMCVHEDSTFSVSGGWFDSQGLSPVRLSVAGCTWGGSAIKQDIVAACGLRMEFGNRVVTTRIREVRVFRGNGLDRPRFSRVDADALFRACYGSGTAGA